MAQKNQRIELEVKSSVMMTTAIVVSIAAVLGGAFFIMIGIMNGSHEKDQSAKSLTQEEIVYKNTELINEYKEKLGYKNVKDIDFNKLANRLIIDGYKKVDITALTEFGVCAHCCNVAGLAACANCNPPTACPTCCAERFSPIVDFDSMNNF